MFDAESAEGDHGFLIVEMSGRVVVRYDNHCAGFVFFNHLFDLGEVGQCEFSAIKERALDGDCGASGAVCHRLVVGIGGVYEEEGFIFCSRGAACADDDEFHCLTSAVCDLRIKPVRVEPAGCDDVKKGAVSFFKSDCGCVFDHAIFEGALRRV